MIAALYVRDFFLQTALRHEPAAWERPIALLDGEKAHIAQITEPARLEGVQEGSTASQGLARCSALTFKTRSPEAESRAQAVLMECGFSCSPRVEDTAPGICTFDLKGTREDQQAMADRILRHLQSLGFSARLGIAENPDLALLAAHCAEPFLSVVDTKAFLGILPMAAIRPSEHLARILHSWGILTLGAFAALSREEITSRLGAEAMQLWDRASGRSVRLLKLALPPAVYEEGQELEYAVETLEPLLFLIQRCLDQLCLRLEANWRASEELTLVLNLAGGEEYRRLFRIPTPTNHAETLFRILHSHLESVSTTAPVVGLRITAKPARLAPHQQHGLFEPALRNPAQFNETLARLQSLLGPGKVGTPVLKDSHRPDSFEMVDPDFSSPTGKRKAPAPLPPDFGPPLRRFRPPLPARIDLDRREPIWITSDCAMGEIRAVRGPFQLSGDWWDTGAWACEEWDIQLASGEMYRVSLGEENEWRLEGAYD